MADSFPAAAMLKTPLHALHLELGAQMVPFAGYDDAGARTRPASSPSTASAATAAALFDVSHMGQLRLVGADAAAALETLVPVDVVGLGIGKQRYALLHQRRRAASSTT